MNNIFLPQMDDVDVFTLNATSIMGSIDDGIVLLLYNGIITGVISYRNGKLNGTSTLYIGNQVYGIYDYLDGEYHGAIMLYNNGRIAYVGEYYHGLHHGIREELKADGSCIWRENWQYGVLLSSCDMAKKVQGNLDNAN